MKPLPPKTQERARKRLAQHQRKQRDPRFQRVMNQLVDAGLLRTTLDLASQPVTLEDALWAGAVEPRIMELLPAILVKRPALITMPQQLPDDVADVIHAIRHGKNAPAFRGVPAEQYLPWVAHIGRKGRAPSVLKSFRFQRDDVLRLRRLRENLPARSETDVIRMALKLLEGAPQGSSQ